MRAVAAFLPAAQVLLDICLTRFALRGSLNGGLPRSIAGYAQHRQDWSNKPATTELATHLTFSPAWGDSSFAPTWATLSCKACCPGGVLCGMPLLVPLCFSSAPSPQALRRGA